MRFSGYQLGPQESVPGRYAREQMLSSHGALICRGSGIQREVA